MLPLIADTPIARRSDPESSKLAASDVTASGARAAQQAEVLAAVRALPGCTSAEMASFRGWSRFMPARRLPELERAGKVRRGLDMRRCSVTLRLCITWYPV